MNPEAEILQPAAGRSSSFPKQVPAAAFFSPLLIYAAFCGTMARMEKTFAASSGNLCRIEESPHGWMLDWRNPPSSDDQREFLAWANQTFGPLLLEKWGLP